MATVDRDEVEWPDHFPNPGCPPEDVRPVSEDVFYLVSANPPTQKDFRSAIERGAFPDYPPCQRASLSCYLTERYAQQAKGNSPRLKKYVVSRATLSSSNGVIKQTGRPGHHSLWLTKSSLAAAPDLFEVIE